MIAIDKTWTSSRIGKLWSINNYRSCPLLDGKAEGGATVLPGALFLYRYVCYNFPIEGHVI